MHFSTKFDQKINILSWNPIYSHNQKNYNSFCSDGIFLPRNSANSTKKIGQFFSYLNCLIFCAIWFWVPNSNHTSHFTDCTPPFFSFLRPWSTIRWSIPRRSIRKLCKQHAAFTIASAKSALVSIRFNNIRHLAAKIPKQFSTQRRARECLIKILKIN